MKIRLNLIVARGKEAIPQLVRSWQSTEQLIPSEPPSIHRLTSLQALLAVLCKLQRSNDVDRKWTRYGRQLEEGLDQLGFGLRLDLLDFGDWRSFQLLVVHPDEEAKIFLVQV